MVNVKSWKVKYYKGLGTSTPKEAKEYFADMRRHQIQFHHEGAPCDEAILMVCTAVSYKSLALCGWYDYSFGYCDIFFFKIMFSFFAGVLHLFWVNTANAWKHLSKCRVVRNFHFPFSLRIKCSLAVSNKKDKFISSKQRYCESSVTVKAVMSEVAREPLKETSKVCQLLGSHRYIQFCMQDQNNQQIY